MRCFVGLYRFLGDTCLRISLNASPTANEIVDMVFKMKFEKVDDHAEFEQKNNSNLVLFVPHF